MYSKSIYQSVYLQHREHLQFPLWYLDLAEQLTRSTPCLRIKNIYTRFSQKVMALQWIVGILEQQKAALVVAENEISLIFRVKKICKYIQKNSRSRQITFESVDAKQVQFSFSCWLVECSVPEARKNKENHSRTHRGGFLSGTRDDGVAHDDIRQSHRSRQQRSRVQAVAATGLLGIFLSSSCCVSFPLSLFGAHARYKYMTEHLVILYKVSSN